MPTVQRIIRKHGGRVWGEAEPDKARCFASFSADRSKLERKRKTLSRPRRAMWQATRLTSFWSRKISRSHTVGYCRRTSRDRGPLVQEQSLSELCGSNKVTML